MSIMFDRDHCPPEPEVKPKPVVLDGRLLNLLDDAILVINAHQQVNEGDALAQVREAMTRLEAALGTDCHGELYATYVRLIP